MLPSRRVKTAVLLLSLAALVAACSMPPPKEPPKPGATAPVASTSAEPLWLSNMPAPAQVAR